MWKFQAFIQNYVKLLTKGAKMTSKKVTINEKPKGTKGVFRRSESVMPAGFNIRKPSTPINDVNTNGKESQPFFRRSESVMPAGVNVRNPSTPINDINANGKESQPFFRRSEPVMPGGVNVRNPSTLINDINVKESQPLFRRSSMICSEGFDKYTYDCHRHDIPSRSMVQELKESAFEREIKNSPRNLPLPSTPPTQSMLQELKESAFEREIKNSPRHLPLPSTPSTQSMLQESKESAFEREIKNSPRHLHFPSTPPTQSMLQELKESAFERDIKNSPRHLHFPSTPSTQSMLQELKESAFERETKNSPRNLSLPLILPTLSVAQEIKESAFERETKNSPRNLPHPSTPPALSMVQELKESAFKRETKNSPRNLPIPSTPPAAKPTSILKKKAVSIRSPLIKRDSVVHPGRIDMQRSLCIAGRFQNPWPTWRPPTFTNILKFGISKDKSKVPPKQELELVLPIVKQKFSKLSIPDDGIRVTWIGHSTVLVQMHGLNVLTDPIFSDRASPSQVVGPKRYRDPPCSIHDLPHLNAVVISHSHYDHLDLNTVTLLNARFGTDIRWFVPLGLQSWMQQVGCENVVELDWWEENCVPEHSDTFFVFTPAQHWSKRTIGDDNKVLWGSWCILGPKYRFFFAGDTGYCDVFKQIGRVHGPFDLSAIPIGAYEPRWFMKYQHVNPEEAVQIHMDVRSKRSLAIHWGTFCLANEYYLDPPRKLRDSLDKNEIPPELFFTMKHGESRLVAQTNLVKRGPMYVHNRIEE